MTTDPRAQAREYLSQLARENEISPDSAQTEIIVDYCLFLEEYNKKVNLVADPSPRTVLPRHILDSWSLVELYEQLCSAPPGAIVDVGTGAGLPGLILAIAFPDARALLVDSIRKKTDFLEKAVSRLSLAARVEVECARAEELCREPRRRDFFDLATSRAVGHFRLIAELCLPLLKEGGWLLCQKTEKQAQAEAQDAEELVGALGGRKPEIMEPRIQTGNTRHAVIAVRKEAMTPHLFPRPWSEMKQELKALQATD